MNDWMDAESRVEKAHQLYQDCRWAEAAAELKAAIDINPYNASWHFNLGLTLDAMADYDRAREAYRMALQLQPDDVETLNCLGVCLTRTGDIAESIECFEQIEKIDPTYEPGYCNRIVAYSEAEQHEQAELMFYLARLFKDECPLCYYNIGNSLYARDDLPRAIDCWKQTLRVDPDHVHANGRLAEAYWNLGELDLALEHYQAEHALAPDEPGVLLDMGELLFEMGKRDQAEQAFRKALHVSPDSAGAHYQLGLLAMKEGKHEAAEARFRLALRHEPDLPGAHAKLAKSLIKQGRVQEAAKHLVSEIRTSASDPAMLHEIGQMLIEARLVRHANNVLRRLVELTPGDPYAQHNLAVSYFMLERLDRGIAHCRKALKLKPDYALALYNLALAHMQKGQEARARRYVSRAVQHAPGDPHIRQLADHLRPKGPLVRLWVRLRGRGNG